MYPPRLDGVMLSSDRHPAAGYPVSSAKPVTIFASLYVAASHRRGTSFVIGMRSWDISLLAAAAKLWLPYLAASGSDTTQPAHASSYEYHIMNSPKCQRLSSAGTDINQSPMSVLVCCVTANASGILD